jgi:YVTN family beta-propeller protein
VRNRNPSCIFHSMNLFLKAVFFSLLAALGIGCKPQTPIVYIRTPLVTGKAISPTTQSVQNVGSMPMNLAISPDGKFIITTDIGYRESLWSIAISNGKGISHVDFRNVARKSATSPTTEPAGEDTFEVTQSGSLKSNGLYYGLAIANDRTVYAAQGNHDSIAVLDLDPTGKLKLTGAIRTRKMDFPAGLAVDDVGHLYVTNNASGGEHPYQSTGSVAIYDCKKKIELGRYFFTASHGGTSNFPLGIAALRDGSKIYVAAERDDAVYVLDTRDASKPRRLNIIATGAHPVAVLLSKDQKKLFVANSLSDTISAIDTSSDQITDTVLLRPKMARDLVGVTPVGLALSPDGKTLYAALGDMDAAAVIDVSGFELHGYIPTGWYPSALAVTTDGRLLVANAKGFSVRNPNTQRDPDDAKRKNISILSLLEGNVSAIRIPTGEDLETATRQVLSNNRLDKLEHPAPNPLADIGLKSGNIKHVVYIIKENRTYDQILGDLPEGNGDKSLALFGRSITPNQHALAERFVLLDDFYACGEVSGDGWAWSTQGMADAYVSRNVPYHYSHRGRKFDFEGQNNGQVTGGFPAVDEIGKPIAKDPEFKNGAEAMPDVGNTGMNLWDSARNAGVSLRNYGFFLSFNDAVSGTLTGPDNYPNSPGLQPPGHDLDGVSDWDYRRFDLDFPDSDAPLKYFRKTDDPNCLFKLGMFGRAHATSRFAEWNREFKLMFAKDPSGESVPALMMIRFPTDHTAGAKGGSHSPASYVADNDYAVGQLVDAISHSPIWSSTAIFIVEDDAQSGADHVDAHRTTAYIISPWIKAQSVDHHFYNTDSMLKTIELLLGMKPLSQYDAVADPILDWDSSPANGADFGAQIPTKSLIAQLNPRKSQLRAGDPRLEMALRSEQMDFTHADAAPAQELDDIVWKTVKGPDSPAPRPRGMSKDKDKDDDDD